MRVKTYIFNPIFRVVPLLRMAGVRKAVSGQIYLLCCKCQKFVDPLACRTRGRRDRNFAAIAWPEQNVDVQYL